MKKNDPHILLNSEKGVELVAEKADMLRMMEAIADMWEKWEYKQTALRVRHAIKGAAARMEKAAE